MLSFCRLVGCYLAVFWLFTACVDPEDLGLLDKLDVIVVDGTITSLAEPQIIHLKQSKSVSGLPGSVPITKATVDVVVDSGQVIAAHETTEGNYQLPNDFKGQIGHRYQLRFMLSDGTRYQSTPEVMHPVPPIVQVRAQFNPTSISPPLAGYYTAGHDLFIDTQDPPGQSNYYRWEWTLYEKQDWCRSCPQALYLVWDRTDSYLAEECDRPDQIPGADYFVNDYPCRTACWQHIYSSAINVFSDQYSNGGRIVKRNVGQIPFYDHSGALVELRQTSLTSSAYTYFKRFQDQTQHTGGLADTPPSVPAGNVHNVTNKQEVIVGYFTASAVDKVPYWLDRKDTQGIPPGLFQALNGRDPSAEGELYLGKTKPLISIPKSKYYDRPPTALCVPSESRTPFKPIGWRD
ncbi:MAG: DUF4249 domain-containing protein [Cytophagaceae bacterium]|nr:MAG: DUF4249 domain-containing protein [Cytophagaceae bacterium]